MEGVNCRLQDADCRMRLQDAGCRTKKLSVLFQVKFCCSEVDA